MDLHKQYTRGDRTVPVLRDVNLSLEPGDMVAIVGASGVGKSTLLHVLGGLDRPQTGTLRYRGRDVYGGAAGDLPDYRNPAVVLGAGLSIGVQVNRVPVPHGHTACLAIECDRPVSEEEARALYAGYRARADIAALPSSPAQALAILPGRDRPQPALDADLGGGMTVSVGRIRGDAALCIRLVACGHNLVRGAAGAALLNAELAVSRGFLCQEPFTWAPDGAILRARSPWDSSMFTMVRRFIKTGLGFLGLGLLLGAYLLVRRELEGVFPDRYLVSAHVHAMGVGFVMFMILGVQSRAT